MQLTLHLTNNCNLNCSYCFVDRNPKRMSKEVAFAAVDLGLKGGRGSSGLLFYGGEPLLEKDLIYDITEYAKAIKEKTGHVFYYKMTTNGMLLDEDFLKFSQSINLAIGFSHDGPAQDDCRLLPTGEGSFSMLDKKIPMLLKYQPYAIGMSVVDQSTVHKAAAIVKFLFKKGFKYITLNLNYSKDAPWTKKHLTILEDEYKKMAELYIKWTKSEQKFYLSPFDIKILSHLKGEQYHEDRHKMSLNQPSVAPDGKIYLNSKFLGNPIFEIGNVFVGIDFQKQKDIFQKGLMLPKFCKNCVLRQRCNYVYGNLDNQGAESAVAPIQCAHEQLLTPIADSVAEKLFKMNNALFIHKHYNDLYPIMSLLEDRG